VRRRKVRRRPGGRRADGGSRTCRPPARACAGYLRFLQLVPPATAPHVWSLLRICLAKLNRYDLVARTERCDVDDFRAEFDVASAEPGR